MANAALDVTRRRKVRDADELPETVASPFRDPAEGSELRSRLKQALDRLPARQRAVIVLRYYEDLTEAQTAQVLGVSVGTVKSQHSDALKRLRGVVPGLVQTGS